MIDRLERETLRFLAGLFFLTRIPMPHSLDGKLPPIRNAAGHFGLIGALIGAITGAIWLLACTVLPAAAAAGLAVAAGLLLTGCLHEDGLADTFDALGARASRERTLEIFRDSRIGTYGAAALVVAIGLRWALLASLPPWEGALALVLSHAARTRRDGCPPRHRPAPRAVTVLAASSPGRDCASTRRGASPYPSRSPFPRAGQGCWRCRRES